MIRGGHAGLEHHLLGEPLGALQPGRGGRRPEGPDSRLDQRVHQPGDQRSLRPHHDQVDPFVAGGGDQGIDVVRIRVQDPGVGGDAGIARRAEQLRPLRRARQRPNQRVLTPPGSDDECPQGPERQSPEMKSSTGMAVSVSYFAVPREPSSIETRAMVCSSGASTTFTKSNCPRVAHCALTVAPSCSISLETSLMRCGLFLTVCTPSGVSVVSMMYVGMGPPISVAVAPGPSRLFYPNGEVRATSPPGCRVRSGPGSQAAAASARSGASANTSSPSAASTRTLSPSANSPSSTPIASRSTSRFWITRLSGRAP